MTIPDFILFLLFILIIIFPAGKLVLSFLDYKLSFWEEVLTAVVLGALFISLGGFISGITGFSSTFYFLPAFTLSYLLIKNKLFENFRKDFFLKSDIKLISVIIFISLLSSYFTFFSGTVSSGKMKLIGGNSHDGLWHIALINNLSKDLLPQSPIFSGTRLQNYHYLTDIFATVAYKYTGIPVTTLYFKILPFFFIFLFCWVTYVLLRAITKSRGFSIFGILLAASASNLFYTVKFIYPEAYISPSVFWVDEFSTKFVNPQLLFSYIILLTFIFLLFLSQRINTRQLIFFSVAGGSLLAIKSYAFIVLFLSLAVIASFYMIRRQFHYMLLSAGIAVSGAVMYFLSNITTGGVFIFAPFWFIKTMFETNDHLAYPIWELKRQTYLAYKNFLRIGQLYFEGLMLFLIGNLGGRMLGFLALNQKAGDKEKNVCRLLVLVSFFSLVLPLVFIQKGVVWNSIQFSYYSVISLSLLTAIVLSRFYIKKKLTVVTLALIIWVSLLPGVFYNIKSYYPQENDFYGTDEVLSALLFLKDQKDGIVLADSVYTGDSLVPALSRKSAYFADEIILSIQLIDFDVRKKETDDFFKGRSKNDFLKKNNIKYIFARKGKTMLNQNSALKLNKIYTNQDIEIYKIL